MLLLPEHYPTHPFVDSTPLLGDARALHARAHDQGYLYLRSLFTDEEVAPVRALVRTLCVEHGWVLPDPANPPSARAAPDAYFQGRGWDDPRFADVQRRFSASPITRRFITEARLMDILRAIWGEPGDVSDANHVWVKLPGSPEHTTRPHQDTFYLPTCPRMWSVWYPIAHTPLDVGPLAVIPGSHRREYQHISAFEGIDIPRDTAWHTQGVRSGDVVLFHATTVHCAWSNVSEQGVRMSLDIRYEPASTSPSILRPRAV